MNETSRKELEHWAKTALSAVADSDSYRWMRKRYKTTRKESYRRLEYLTGHELTGSKIAMIAEDQFLTSVYITVVKDMLISSGIEVA